MDKVQEAFNAWWESLPHCIGPEGCDGDLEGMEHAATCPVKTPGRTMDVTYFDAFEAGFKVR